jgi:putative ABC transport system permease protein
MHELENIGFFNILIAYVLISGIYLFVRGRGIKSERLIVIATIRMTFQLILCGYVLDYIFDAHSLWLTLLILCIMEIVAVFNIFRVVNLDLSREMKRSIALSIFLGTLGALFFFIFLVIGQEPWYNPRYLIPIGGMLMGNSTNGIALGITGLLKGIDEKRDRIEALLMLGAKPYDAVKDIINSSFSSSILPLLNSMIGAGIVALPGMMTGQILSGESPLIAIKYQIIVYLGIIASVAITTLFFLLTSYKCFFNKRWQLVE